MRFLALLFAPFTAFADTVVLEDGQELEGIVTEDAERVTVTLDFGSVSFDRSEVVEVRRSNTLLHELEAKKDKLAPDDVPGRIAVARWAEANGLGNKARTLYMEILAIRPDDKEAHEKLGHHLHDGKWLGEEEYLAATGHVRYGGRWVTADEAEALERDAEERKLRIEEARIARLESQLAQQKARIEDLESKPEEKDDSVVLYGGYWPLRYLYQPPSVTVRGRFRVPGATLTYRGGVSGPPGNQSPPPARPAPMRGSSARQR